MHLTGRHEIAVIASCSLGQKPRQRVEGSEAAYLDRTFEDSSYTTSPDSSNRALGMLNGHVASFRSWTSFWCFHERHVVRRRQETLRTQTTAQAERPQRSALLYRRTGPTEMKTPTLQGREVDLQTLRFCKGSEPEKEPYLSDLGTIFQCPRLSFGQVFESS